MNSLLQKYIDNKWKKANLCFILLGSLVSFMRDDVLGSSAPLHGRANLELKIKPFGYKETARFVPNYNAEEKAIVYGLTGGIAKYLEQFDSGLSLDENIEDLFFFKKRVFFGGTDQDSHNKRKIKSCRVQFHNRRNCEGKDKIQ